MTSFRQIEANRRNALRSTGPKTEDGKRRSRQNAVRHGLTSETVIVALEDIEDYQAFEAAVIADYVARLPFRPIWRAGRGRRLVQRLGGVALGPGRSVERLAGIAHAGELTQLEDWARRNLPATL